MIHIFSDGSSLGNPGPGGWGVIVASPDSIVELGGREEKTTNNRMELRGAIEALRYVSTTQDSITLFTDSKYTIDGITKWVSGWKKNGWQTKNKTEVLNRDLWEELVRVSEGRVISWEYVEGHAGIPGNERVDAIATSFAGQKPVPLYHGSPATYAINLSITKADSPKQNSSFSSSQKAFSYLALLDGTVHRFTDWKSCEAFVKGKKARFRKALSSENEKEILESWGVVAPS